MAEFVDCGPHKDGRTPGTIYLMRLDLGNGMLLKQHITLEDKAIRQFLKGDKYLGTTWYDYIASDVFFRQDKQIGIYVNIHRSWDDLGNGEGEYLLLSEEISLRVLSALEKLYNEHCSL